MNHDPHEDYTSGDSSSAIGVAVALALILVAVALAAVLLQGCGDETPAPADAASCSSLGCDGPLLCDSKGSCVCDGVRCDP